MNQDDGSGRHRRVEIDPDESLDGVELTASLHRSVPWDPEDREIASADGAAF